MELSHVGIWVEDMEETKRFYQGILGLQEQSSYQISAEIMEAIFEIKTPCQVKVFGFGNTRVEIFDAPEGIESGINHFAVSVEDKSKFCQEAASKGARVIEVWRGDHPVYFLKSPSGVLIEIRD